MNVKVDYRCDTCGETHTTTMKIGHPPQAVISHEGCGGVLVRVYGDRTLDKQEDTVSSAIQTMLFARMPSNKNKAVI